MSRRFIFCVLMILTLSASSFASPAQRGRVAARREVKVYLVAVDDDGRAGKKIGCGDSLVAVTRRINAGDAPLKATIQELLLIPHDYDARLKNFWRGERLRVRSASVARGVATVNISGRGPTVGGVCDQPRIESQIEETARQFPNVRRVRVFVNGRPLASALR